MTTTPIREGPQASTPTSVAKYSLLAPPRARRACGNCSKQKERCVITENDVVCQRCVRLRKECIFPLASRKRQKTDGSLATSNDVDPNNGLPTPASTTSSTLWSAVGAGEPSAAINLVPSPTVSALDNDRKTALYANFLDEMNVYIPFLVISDRLRTAAACEQQSPFTFAACIIAALHRQTSLQKMAAREMLSYIGHTMIMQGTKSLDLLQGLLLLITWYYSHAQRNPQLMNLIHLATALLVDLGLTRSSASMSSTAIMSNDVPQLMYGTALESVDQCMAAHRALLGHYYVQAQISVAFRRLEYPRWTSYMEECCQKLRDASAHPHDIHIYHVARLYQCIERYICADSVKPSPSYPVRAYVSCFREDLQRIRSSLPLVLVSFQQFELHLQHAELALYESAIDAGTFTDQHQSQLVGALHACLARLNTFFDLFLSQPVETFPDFSFLHFCQLSHAFDLLAKLSFFRAPGWDLTYMRNHTNFVSIGERVTDKFEDIYNNERMRFPDLEYSRFAIYPMKMRHCKKWYEARLAAEVQEAQEKSNATNDRPSSSTDVFGNTTIPGSLGGAMWSWPMDDDLGWSMNLP